MSYSLENFCDDTRAILRNDDNAAGHDQVRQKLELLLQDLRPCHHELKRLLIRSLLHGCLLGDCLLCSQVLHM